jgi:putative hydrolase of the HAD superfamily
MRKKPNLIFDAGGVLVFPNFDFLAQIANRVGIATSPQEIAEQHAKLFRAFDEHVVQHHQFPAIDYFPDLFKRVTDSVDKVQSALERILEAQKDQHLWATTQPWVGEALRKLKRQGYQMAVISNSEGTVEQILEEVDLRDNFEIVIDSFVVGVEKPDPRIFEIALERLEWDHTDTIYIGDIFYIDIWGANRAGLGAIHLDKMGLYDGWEGERIPSLRELPEWLTHLNGNPQKANLFPTRDFTIQ